MTPRERVLAAVNRRKVDRLPADIMFSDNTAARIMEKTGAADFEEVLQVLAIDMRRIDANYAFPDKGPDADGYCRDMWGMRYRLVDGRRCDFVNPFNENSTVDDVNGMEWPDAALLDYSSKREEARSKQERYATYGSPWSPFFHETAWMLGQENFLVWMHSNPELVEAVIGRIVDFEIEATRRFLDATKGFLDITYFGNDFGTQRGLFISPEMFCRFIRGPLKRFFDISRDYGCKVMFHSCGCVRELIPMLIEDGVDIVDPIQVSCKDMSLESLSSEFGSRIVFHGGICTQRLLPFGSVGEVKGEVARIREHFKDRSGYILTASQGLMDDIPVENILAMYERNNR